MNYSAIEIDIEELALTGLAVPDEGGVRAALVAELAQLLGAHQPAALQSEAAVARLDGGALTLAPGQTAQELGRSIAQTVYRSLGGQS